MWGVATIVDVSAADAAAAMAIASGIVPGPSSRPGRTWQCRSITLPYGSRASARAKVKGAHGLVCDVTGDRERRTGSRRGRVANVQRPRRVREEEVVEQAPVARERLRAHPCIGRFEIAGLDAGHEALRGARDGGARC